MYREFLFDEESVVEQVSGRSEWSGGQEFWIQQETELNPFDLSLSLSWSTFHPDFLRHSSFDHVHPIAALFVNYAFKLGNTSYTNVVD
jgi:hypothetical protein